MRSSAILICLCCVGATAQQPAVFKTEAKMVVIHAVVTTKNGDSVADLTAKDFRVWEDNKQQTIRSFGLEAAASSAEPRRMVLFFDDTTLSPSAEANARQATARFIDGTVSPTRLIAIATFNGSWRVAQSFTADAARLKDGLRDVRLAGASPATGEPRIWRGRQPVEANNSSANAFALIASLENLAQNLSALPGRKMIVLFSSAGSFSSLPAGEVSSLAKICNRSDVAIYPVIENGGPDLADTFAGPVGPGPQGVPGPPGPRGANDPSIPEVQANANVPFTIAKETGGISFPLSNDLAGDLQKIGAEQNQYYAIGYTPPDSKAGACHNLRLKVDRKHVDVRARSSYCTAKSEDVLAESRVERDLEKLATEPSTGDHNGEALAEMQAPFFYTASNLARVDVAVEFAPQEMNFEKEKGRLRGELNLLGIAQSADGRVAARFSDVVRRDFANAEDVNKFKEQPLHYEKEFKIIPGRYRLTVAFRSGESAGKLEMPLVIAGYDAGQFALSALTLSKQVRPAAQVGLEGTFGDEATALIAGGRQLVPSGSNVFDRGEPGYCYFEIYTQAGASSATVVHLRALDAKTGALKWDGGSAKVEPPAAGKSTIPVGLRMPTNSLAAGAYQFEIAATDAQNQTIRRTVEFEIK